MPTQIINLNNTTPAAPANAQNIEWQADAPSLDVTVARNVSAYVPVMRGDSGSGGAAGLAPAPAAGDAAAGKVLSANGAFEALPLVIGFVIITGATGNNIGPMLMASRAGSLSKCTVIVKASDGSIALTFRIKQNGADIFSANPTIAAATTSGAVSISAALTSSPLAVSAGDVFSIDITSGSASWAFTAQLS